MGRDIDQTSAAKTHDQGEVAAVSSFRERVQTKFGKPARLVWIALGAFATIGGAWGTAEMIFAPDKPAVGLSDARQADLLQMVIDGDLSPEQAESLAFAMTGQAFPETTIGRFADLPQNSEERRYAEGVRDIAQSPDAKRRAALAQISNPLTRADGFAMLVSLAQTQDDWRQLGELAFPWDVAAATKAYVKVVETGRGNSWDYIYLGRSYERAGRSENAKQAYRSGLTLTNDPRDRSVVLSEIADVALTQNDFPTAESSLKEALEITKTLLESDPDSSLYLGDIAIVYRQLGKLARETSHIEIARVHYEKALSVNRELSNRTPSKPSPLRGVSNANDSLGLLAMKSKDWDAARAHYSEALNIRRTLNNDDRSNPVYRRDLSISYSRLADVMREQEQWSSAFSFLNDALEIDEALVAGDPSSAIYRRGLGTTLLDLGDIARASQDMTMAESRYVESLDISRQLVALDPANATYQHDVMIKYDRLGGLASKRDDQSAAKDAYEKSLMAADYLLEGTPTNADYQTNVADRAYNLGNVSRDLGDPTAAWDYYTRAHELLGKRFKAEPKNLKVLSDVSRLLSAFSALAEDQDDGDTALTLSLDGLRVKQELAEIEPDNTQYQNDLVVGYLGLVSRQPEKAMDYLKAAKAVSDRLVENDQLNETGAEMREIVLGYIEELSR